MSAFRVASDASRNRVIVTGAFRFPNGDAGGGRVLNLGKALRKAGFEVLFLGLPIASGGGVGVSGPCYFHGFEYWTCPDAGIPSTAPGLRLLRYLRSGEETLAAISREDFSRVHAVVAYGGTSRFLLRLRHICRRRRVPMVSDCVEWYHPSQRPGGILGAVHVDDSIRMQAVLPTLSGVIGISSFLGRYYTRKGCPTFVLPPVIDAQDSEWPQTLAANSQKGLIRLAFLGSPDRERWDLILAAMDRLAAAGTRAEIDVFGGGERHLVQTLGHLAERWLHWRRHVHFQGRPERSHLLKNLAEYDASFILREDERWSRACFPSKIPELLRLGLPLLFNDTSDLCQYIEDGREGFLVKELSAEGFTEAVTRLAQTPLEKRRVMRTAAVNLARKHFDYRGWVASLSSFFRALGGLGDFA